MIALHWTERAEADLAAIRAFIEADSPAYAEVVVRRFVSAVDVLRHFPQVGRMVEECPHPTIRELVHRPYRIVYRVVSAEVVHVLTIHHGARWVITSL